MSSLVKHAVLNTGHQMPIIGLGTWQAKPAEVEAAVLAALDEGYRHIDTAFNYNNEQPIGEALRKWLDQGKGTREQLFVVTKLPVFGCRADDVSKYLARSLDRLQLDYVDLYLVHMPFGLMPDETGQAPALTPDGSFELDYNTDHVALWKAMEAQVDTGKARAIGVSNFNLSQLQRVISCGRIRPANIQVELHAYLQQKELRLACAQLGIPVTAYSPLGSPGAKEHFVNKYNYSPASFPDLLNHPTVLSLAQSCDKTPAQILLRHLVQSGVIVIPKSASPQRIRQNFQIFDFTLPDSAMSELDALDRGDVGRIMDFLFFKGIEKHPEYPFMRIE